MYELRIGVARGRSTDEMVGEGGNGDAAWIGEVGAESLAASTWGDSPGSASVVACCCAGGEYGDAGGRGGSRGGLTERIGVG